MYSKVSTDWVTRHSLEESYPSAEMYSVSTAQEDWASLGESYPSAEMPSVYSTADWAGLLKVINISSFKP